MSGESHQALARLAGRDTASLVALGVAGTATSDKDKVLYRLRTEMICQDPEAEYNWLIRHLQSSDLTINFRAYKFFAKKPKGVGYVNQFEGANQWGGDTYVAVRDGAEQAMFNYNGANARPASVPAAVANRAQMLGNLDNLEFEPAVRPKYAGLNYAGLKYGASANWGKSFMVLKEYVKHNATYVHTDSFDVGGNARQLAALAGQVATFARMDRLLVNMVPNMFKALVRAAHGVSYGADKYAPGLGKTCYIEAQVHGEILFERDIAKIVISMDELTNAKAKAEKAGLKPVSPDKLRDTYTKFSKKYGIPVILN